ncbi:MAG: hypothetical protein ACETVR_04110 [Candidatus Bathyarchaeia archaeon]
MEDVKFSYVPPSGKGCGYHVIGLQLNFYDRSPAEVNALVRALMEDDPEIWVRGGFGGNSFAINTLTLVDGDEKIIVERFKKIMG